jgi:hypothetical protein
MGKVTGWNAGKCQHGQISELVSMEKRDQAVVNVLVATEVGMFLPK